MSLEDFNILESVIHITAARDIKSLENVLLDELSDIGGVDTLILLSFPRGCKQNYLEVTKSIPQDAYLDKLKLIGNVSEKYRVAMDKNIIQSISDQKTIIIKRDEVTRLIIPVIINKKVIGIVDLYTGQYNKNTEKLINFCIRIYRNFLAVLHDNEHDTLTGLLNRKTFDARISEILTIKPAKLSPDINQVDRRSHDQKMAHWVGMLDIDHFKKINDNFGHIYGDEVLILFSDKLKDVFRSSDLLFRFGGEEFIVVMLNVLETDAVLVFNRFRSELEQTDFPQVGQVTVSIGMTKVDPASHITDLLDRADQSLYYAKDNGRNQICNYHELVRRGLFEEKVIESDIELF